MITNDLQIIVTYHGLKYVDQDELEHNIHQPAQQLVLETDNPAPAQHQGPGAADHQHAQQRDTALCMIVPDLCSRIIKSVTVPSQPCIYQNMTVQNLPPSNMTVLTMASSHLLSSTVPLLLAQDMLPAQLP